MKRFLNEFRQTKIQEGARGQQGSLAVKCGLNAFGQKAKPSLLTLSDYQ
jgi:hypothetical protein